MRKHILALAAIGLAVGGAQRAGAGENDSDRGRTYVRDSRGNTTEIFILRGTEPKDQAGIKVTDKEPAAKEEAPKTKTVRRGKRTYTVPNE